MNNDSTAGRRRLVTRPVAVMIAATLCLGMVGGAAGVALGEIGAAAQHHRPGHSHDVRSIDVRSQH